jgi:GT2 family glycosyltransferase
MPDAIEQMVRFLQTYPEVDFVYADSYRIDATGVVDRQDVLRTRPPESLRDDNFIGACFLYKRSVYEAVGDYDPRAALAEDYDYWVRVSRQFRMQRLFRTLYCYRFHDRSLTARHTREEIASRVASIREQQPELWS